MQLARLVLPAMLVFSVCAIGCDEKKDNALPPPGMAGAGQVGAVAQNGAAGANPHAGVVGAPNSGTAGTVSNAGDPLNMPGAGEQVGPVLKGTVVETMNVTEYTYIRFKTDAGAEEWAAIPKTTINVGDKVTVQQSIVMNAFHSPSLNRTFDKIIFATLVAGAQ